jgi:Right handed beta helix region
VLNSFNETRALSFDNVNQLAVRNCSFINIGQAGVVLVKCTNSVIQNNYFYDIAQGRVSADAIQVNGSFNTQIVGNLLENVQEGIFCQHHASTQTPNRWVNVWNNQIRTLEVAQSAQIQFFIDLGTLQKMNLESFLSYSKAGIARGPAIGILSNHAAVYDNTVSKHVGIVVASAKAHGNLSTDNVTIRNNWIFENAKVPYFNEQTGQMVQSENAAITVTAAGQKTMNVFIRNNHIVDAYQGGVQLIMDPRLGISSIMNVTINNNELKRVCKNFAGAIRFKNIGQQPENQFINVKIQRNILEYEKGYGLWFEPCMKGVEIIQNTFAGFSGTSKINFASGSCLQKIDDAGDFDQSEINCLLVPQGICVGCVAQPSACVAERKCVHCN